MEKGYVIDTGYVGYIPTENEYSNKYKKQEFCTEEEYREHIKEKGQGK